MVFQWLKSKYQALQTTFSSTKKEIGIRLKKLFGRYVDEALLEEIEAILYEADLGVDIIQDISNQIRLYIQKNPKAAVEDILGVIEKRLIEELTGQEYNVQFAPAGEPTIFLFIGTNGNGKTTSCAKMAHYMVHEYKKKVLFGACDTFRAAAQEQLALWSEALNIEIVAGKDKGDPAAVAFDTVSRAKARNVDLVLIDTAGRLENKTALLKELEKIKRSCQKAYGESSISVPHETFLVLDATTGQNGLEQAKAFHQATPITGIILTKLDGSARGGTLFAIQRSLKIPVKFIGIGEKPADLIPFDPELFVQSMLYDEKEPLLSMN